MPIAGGSRLGPYEVVGALGAGGMGEVYRARDPRIGREVAIKVLPASYAEDPERLRRFEQEARTVGSLNHPNLLVLFDVGTHEGAPYLVSELLEGGTLRETLGRTPPSVRKAIDYGAQIARGLAAAHDKGVVHRDLKPDNVFLTPEGRVKILDFGLARVTRVHEPAGASVETLSSPTGPGVLLGTLGYMSPEQVRGQPADHRADIFAFGSVLYEVVTGQRAFRGETSADTMSAILNKEPKEMSASGHDVPPALERILRRCLEKNAAERFQSAHDLAFALEALSGSGVSGTGAAIEEPPRRWRRPLQAAVLLGALALPALALLAGKAIWDRPAPKFQRLTFRRGRVTSAQFSGDGHTVVYGAEWGGQPPELFSTRLEGRESRSFGLPSGDVLAVSSAGEMAISSNLTLSRVPMAGGSPRAVFDVVSGADWSPDGKDMAVVRVVGGKRRLEYPIGTIVFETKEEEDLSPVRLSPKGDLFAVGHFAGQEGSVAVVDLKGRMRVLARHLFWGGELDWSPGGDEIWFTASRGGEGWSDVSTIYAVDLQGRERVLLRVPGWPRIRDVSRDGRVLLSIGQLRSEVFGLAPGETQERDLSWAESTSPVGMSKDGHAALFSEPGQGSGNPLYIRRMDGSPPVRVGEGWPAALSLDARWVAAGPPPPGPRDHLTLFPTGAGEARSLRSPGLEYGTDFWWFFDNKRLYLKGRERGGPERAFIQDVDGSPARAFVPEGTSCFESSGDDTLAICQDSQEHWGLYPLGGGPPRPIQGLEPGEYPSFLQEGLAVIKKEGRARAVYAFDPVSGRRTLWKRFEPKDRAGLVGGLSLWFTADGKAYVYGYTRELSDLYLVSGLH